MKTMMIAIHATARDNWSGKFHPTALIVGLMVTHVSALAQTPWSAQQGDAAIRTLREQGVYDSLQQAVTAARYEVQKGARAGYRASNGAQGYDVKFTPEGVSLAMPNWRATMRFASYGYGEHLALALEPELAAKGNRVEYRRVAQPVTEWYVNRASGVEQGFTIAFPPGVRSAGERLRLVMEVTGDLHAQRVEGGDAVVLATASGERALTYSSLHVSDARGRELSAEMTTTEREVILEVDDSGAEYPLTIDPVFTLQQRLIGIDGTPGGDHFGDSVAIWWNTAVVGASGDDGAKGAAYVFVRSGNVWTQQQKLTAPSRADHDAFGRSVAVFGNTLAVGAANDDYFATDQGSVFIFNRTGATWSLQQQLVAADGGPGDLFGFSVAIDQWVGNTLVVGAPLDDISGRTDQGSAYVYVKNGSFWSLQQKLTAGNGAAGHNFGWSVAVEGSIGMAVVGAHHGGNIGQGAAYVFTRLNGVWGQQAILTAFDGSAGDQFGLAVAIKSRGGPNPGRSSVDDVGANVDQGSAYLFSRNGNTWSLLAKLTAYDGAARDGFGWSVGLTGSDVVVGSPYDDAGATIDQGSAYVSRAR